MKQLGYASKATRQPGTSESKGCPSTDTSVALEPAHTVKLESQQRAGQHEEGAGAAAQVRGALHVLLDHGYRWLHVLFHCMKFACVCSAAACAERARSVGSRGCTSRSQGGRLVSRALAGGGHRDAPLCWQRHTGERDGDTRYLLMSGAQFSGQWQACINMQCVGIKC